MDFDFQYSGKWKQQPLLGHGTHLGFFSLATEEPALFKIISYFVKCDWLKLLQKLKKKKKY